MTENKFSNSEIERFYWQTAHPYVSDKEKDLLKILTDIPGEYALEVGCGEAANIYNMRTQNSGRNWIGIDMTFDKVSFCQSLNTGKFLCGDGLMLPFKSDIFDLVFARDFLHHVDHGRETAINEMIRVCKKDGKIILFEANGKKLIYKIFRSIDNSEVGMRNSTPLKLRKLMRKYDSLMNINILMLEPSIFFRLVFHYKIGICRIGFENVFRWLSRKIEQISINLCPKDRWGYIVVISTKK
ncbi:MAG: hypothetical protein A2W05_01145 [Candidatus Schekmanbacteria bacterium RBG_16_38_10]|uniref:Methyltransferase type 11 domain-containing protein n=1 Tax=Candidatus Schekmanbacteria bacterium RBG_16_38_10 TaxID=1817879 RepID=A0A1F7RX05_9BACT|nr:MAG: hypothetical protein A2W05_01145 [Candidatus Schekmanbacteria bacterium RBG_16_38_10]